ncbi:hypothetical protein AWH56_018370 [Anaerobacillus isosaccharinicus]|uniref:Lipoprotein n=1 Tax=Anaerobacillus isosaccharinicus TaxID=1532552 RepID=A0A1S2M6F6_9BACI|nr:hypothetical protein [Anaerobacillus isosaccharinicus]MBA5587130.1 hypothetical protein [Anaerobacillus isosaccharinicus]QOY34674.1 hypothetical protein AWH56_018370 [Anaerobacillus isosaccharinicus]
MCRKILILFVLLLLSLAACSSKTLTFSGQTDNWSANLKVIQTSDYETQEFVLQYKGNDVNSVGKITYSVDSVGGFGRSGATLAENGTLKDSSEANPTNAKVSVHTEIEVTVEWNGNIEKIKLSK